MPLFIDVCTVLGMWWCFRLMVTAARAHLTFQMAHIPDSRRFSWIDLPAVSIVGVLLLFALIDSGSWAERVLRMLVGCCLAFLWWRARALELRESGMFVRGAFVSWSSIRTVSEMQRGNNYRLNLARQWKWPLRIFLTAENNQRLVDVIRGACRYEPTPLATHLVQRLYQVARAAVLLLLAVGVWYAVTIAAE